MPTKSSPPPSRTAGGQRGRACSALHRRRDPARVPPAEAQGIPPGFPRAPAARRAALRGTAHSTVPLCAAWQTKRPLNRLFKGLQNSLCGILVLVDADRVGVSRSRRALDAEGAAAAAGALHMRVVELEPRTFKRLDVVNLHSVQIHRAHLVHGNLQAVELEHVIRLIGLILEGHVILESRASPAHNRDAQRRRHRVLQIHDFLDLCSRYWRQTDHALFSACEISRRKLPTLSIAKFGPRGIRQVAQLQTLPGGFPCPARFTYNWMPR